MLIWVCALHCEAKPVIDYYRLKKSHENNPFDLYLGDGTACIISGIGKVASATACAWIAASYRQQSASLAWINLGIAGAGEPDIGSLFSLHQVIDADDGRRYYPAPATRDRIEGGSCMTLSLPGEDYRDDCLYDMEASGFMQASLRFSSAELIKSLKIVSDNRLEKTGNNRQRVSQFIEKHIDDIVSQADNLVTRNSEVAALSPASLHWQQLTSLTHFSQTQKNRLRVLWRYLMNRNFDAEKLLAQLAGFPASAIIENLEQLSYRDSEQL